MENVNASQQQGSKRQAVTPKNNGAAGEPRKPGQRPSVTERTATVAELLRNGIQNSDAGDGGAGNESDLEQSGAAGSETDEQPQARMLDELVETLGIDLASFWETTEFRDADGKTHKLGALKDTLRQSTNLDDREFQFAERKTAEENELLRQRQELDIMVRQIPAKLLPPELHKHAKAERERILSLENERTLKAIPEWKDEATKKKERAAMGEFIKRVGFAAGDLDRMTDHRLVKLLRDYWQQHERVQAALGKVSNGAGKPGKPASSGGKPPRSPLAKIGPDSTQTERVSAIATLLREGVSQQ